MILNSFAFLCVIPLVLFLYAVVMLLCRRSRRVNVVSAAFLTAVSYGFFLYEQPSGALFLFAITVITYLAARLFDGCERYASTSRRRWTLGFIAVLLVAAPLVIFKYTNFLNSTFADILALAGFVWEPPRFSFVVPLGISFFTFQALGYMLEVYRRQIPAERNFLFYTLFVGFFPQIASGPISKADELLPQIKQRKYFTVYNLTEGARLMLWGYFLKAVVADRLATFVNPVYDNWEAFSGISCFLASVFYSLQIYGDFAGYSLIAIGVGKLFGFDLINNFQRPYLAHSVTDFWRRWHISLTRWLRENIYFPLGGNRKGKSRTYLNILATFTVSGIWHGANLTFIVWGFIHGVVQAVERFFGWGAKPAAKWIVPLRILLTFLIVNFAWIFFRLPSLKDACGVVGRILTFAPGEAIPVSNTGLVLLLFAIVSLFASEIVMEYAPGVSLLRNRRLWVRIVSVIALVFIILTVGVLDSGQFIYVNF